MKHGFIKKIYFDFIKPQFSTMDLYIFRELMLPFLFGMGIFTSLSLSIGTVFDLVRKVTESGLLLGTAVQILILKMPEFIVFAFPMSVLLATLMAYTRLSSDSEIIALQSIGITIYRLIYPAIFFSILIVSLTFVFNNFVAPAANYQATITLAKALDKAGPSFKERNILYPEYNKATMADGSRETVLTRLFYAEEFDGERMRNITIIDRSQESVSQIIVADSATWNILENIWDFYSGRIYLLGEDGSYQNVVRFQHQKLALPSAPLDLTKKGRDYNEMNLFQAQEYLNIVKLSGKDKKVRKLKVRIQQKISLPFACLVFALIGTAIGIKPQNAGKGMSFGICIGLIFFYYLFSFISGSMGIKGVISPFLASWLPNFVVLGAAIFMLTGTRKGYT